MKPKILAAAFCASLMAGTAFAQTDNTGPDRSPDPYDDAFYMANPEAVDFYMDETRAELRTEDEIAEIWAGLDDEVRNRVKGDCERTELLRGQMATTTEQLCGWVATN